MGARRFAVAALAAALVLAACAPAVEPPRRIALLAPFEGRYREVGYELLYSMRLGLADSGSRLVLTSVDIGHEAVERASAIARDTSVLAVVVAGPMLADAAVLDALAGIPTLVVGDWGARPGAQRWLLTSPDIADLVPTHAINFAGSLDPESPLVGGDVYALRQAALIAGTDADIIVVSSARWPDSHFAQRVIASDLFVSPPRLHSTLAYDAGLLVGETLRDATTRRQASDALSQAQVTGLNGRISFDAGGYWADAPVIRYRISDQTLVPAD